MNSESIIQIREEAGRRFQRLIMSLPSQRGQGPDKLITREELEKNVLDAYNQLGFSAARFYDIYEPWSKRDAILREKRLATGRSNPALDIGYLVKRNNVWTVGSFDINFLNFDLDVYYKFKEKLARNGLSIDDSDMMHHKIRSITLRTNNYNPPKQDFTPPRYVLSTNDKAA